jgi:hypothetical protein
MKTQIRRITLAAMLCGTLGTYAAVVEPPQSDAKIAREEAQQLLKERNEARPKAEAAAAKLRDAGRRPEALGFEKAKTLRDEQAAAGNKATAYARYAQTTKEMEARIKRQVVLGQQPIIAEDIARFERLQAEVELARLLGRLPAQEEAVPTHERVLGALRAELRVEQTKLAAGKSTLFQVCSVSKDLRTVELQTSADSAQRMAAHKRHVGLIRALKEETDRRIENGVSSPLDGKFMAQELKEAEAELLRTEERK